MLRLVMICVKPSVLVIVPRSDAFAVGWQAGVDQQEVCSSIEAPEP
jgi:hypothetical protein